MIFRRRRRNSPVIYASHIGNLSIPSDWGTLLWGYTPDMSAPRGVWAVASAPTFRGPSRATSAPEQAVTGYTFENTLAKNRAITLGAFPLDLPNTVSYDGRRFLTGKRMQPQGLPSGGTDIWTFPIDLSSSYAPNTNNQVLTVVQEMAIWDAAMNTASFAPYYAWNTGIQGAIQIVDSSSLYANNSGLFSAQIPVMYGHWTTGARSLLSEDTTSDFYQLLQSSVGVSPRAAQYKRAIWICSYTSSASPALVGYLYVKGATPPAGGYVLGGTKIGYNRTALTWNKAAYPNPVIRLSGGFDGFSERDLQGGMSFGAVGIYAGSSVPSAATRDAIANAIFSNANF